MAVEAIAFSLIKDILYEAFSYFFEAIVAGLVLLILRVSREIDRRSLFEIEWRTLNRSAWPKGSLGALRLGNIQYRVLCVLFVSIQNSRDNWCPPSRRVQGVVYTAWCCGKMSKNVGRFI
jgi:hypothetical protein